MNILHYSLGFPPFRTGGMIKFGMDLMKQQIAEGDSVTLVWPGKIRIIDKKTRYVFHKPVCGINSCEIINPLPVSYDEGITDIERFTVPGDKSVYWKLLQRIKPDVIHIHTLMGLHKSFIEAAAELDIYTVFTTHDFFPICPRVTLFREGAVCAGRFMCTDCGNCNSNALSYNKMLILQSDIYRRLKDSHIVKRLRSSHRKDALNSSSSEIKKEGTNPDTAELYKQLRDHYYSMIRMVDKIHYNSSVSKKVYEEFFDLPHSCVVNITHSDISDHRKSRYFREKDGIIRIRYLGQQSAAKGYYLLIDALDELWRTDKRFRLDLHFQPDTTKPYMCCHDRYDYSELESIFDDTDVLVCPSIWYETFGYTVLEALSYGIPVILSSNVGAQDIMKEGSGIVIDNIRKDSLIDAIKGLSEDRLKRMNDRILEDQDILTIDTMSSMIKEKVYR